MPITVPAMVTDSVVVQILTDGSGWLNLVLIGASGAVLQSRQRLRTTLDRRFFREAYQQEQVLVHLIDEVRQYDSLAEIAKLVSARIDSVLHPTALHVFYRADERSGRFERHSSSDAGIARLHPVAVFELAGSRPTTVDIGDKPSPRSTRTFHPGAFSGP